jgi:hypothetical protein
MPSPATHPAVLIDGPSAGQVIYIPPEVSAWQVAKPVEPIAYSPSLSLGNWVIPRPTLYRLEPRTACLKVRGSAEPAYVRLRIGLSEPGEPDDRAVQRHCRNALLDHPELMPPGAILWPADPADDEPVRIIEQGGGPLVTCADNMQMDEATREIRGTCPCGWRTEFVPTRRYEELRALAMAHTEAAIAWLRSTAGAGSFAEFLELDGFLGQANQRSDGTDAARYALATWISTAAPGLADTITAANRRADERIAAWRDRADGVDYGEPLTEADANWPTQGETCAHVCGGGADHVCDARATLRLKYELPSGGARSMPICGPCFESETASKEPC